MGRRPLDGLVAGIAGARILQLEGPVTGSRQFVCEDPEAAVSHQLVPEQTGTNQNRDITAASVDRRV
jgi:hypothetical protein